MKVYKEAQFYELKSKGQAQCFLCPHNCIISEGNRGICGVREFRSGMLTSLNYGTTSAIALDRIEKKPLYHFYPGSHILSVGSIGCNFDCGFCQNWEIANSKSSITTIQPPELVNMALSMSDNIGIACTYNEPTIWYEFVYDTSRLAKENGLKNVLITNGYISDKPLDKLLPYIDALNIDLKGSCPKFYQEVCSGGLEDVIKTITKAYRHCHVEVTNLLLPDINDSSDAIEKLCKIIFNINPNIPLHFSRYFPAYKFHKEPTPEATMERAKKIGDRWLKYVYLGNLWESNNNTYCPSCGSLLIERCGVTMPWGISDGKCIGCGYNVYGRFQRII